MKLYDLLEYATANPFVGIVSSLDFHIKEVSVAVNASNTSSIFTNSLVRQLTDLNKLLDSAFNWNVPDPKLRSDLHGALPVILKHVASAITALTSNEGPSV